MTARPKRPTQEAYDRALALYRSNCSPEEIAGRTGLDHEVVEHAIVEGWPATRGGKPGLKAFEHVIEDRLHRLELARLDWAQTEIEGAAAHAKDWAQTVKRASAIKQAILSAWGTTVSEKMRKATVGRTINTEKLTPAELSIPLDLVRSLRALDSLMSPNGQKALVDVFRFLSGADEEEEQGAELDRILASLDHLSQEQIDEWTEAGGSIPEPDQQVIPFPGKAAGED